jgi:glycerophosphoryl diester phosphodiesterase
MTAIAKGHGIELDVQAGGKEGQAFVFHDATLDRLTDRSGSIDALDWESLLAVRLGTSDETIPTLPEILALIGGRAPLLIEVKARGHGARRLCRSVASALAGYEGPMAIMSFNPEVGHWFARHAPDILRGLVVTEEHKKGPRGQVERTLALWRSRADFLAYDIRDLPSAFAARARARGIPVLTWTVRSEQDRATAAAHTDQIIYETA